MKEQLASAFGMCRRSAHPNNSPRKTNTRPRAHTLSSLILLSRLLEQHDWSACHLSHENQVPPSCLFFICFPLSLSKNVRRGEFGREHVAFCFLRHKFSSLRRWGGTSDLLLSFGWYFGKKSRKTDCPWTWARLFKRVCVCYFVSHLSMSTNSRIRHRGFWSSTSD